MHYTQILFQHVGKLLKFKDYRKGEKQENDNFIF